MKTCWIVFAATTMLMSGCTDTDDGNGPADAAAEAGLTPEPDCDKYLACYKAAKTAVEYDEELKLFKADGPCWVSAATTTNCINLCKKGYDDLSQTHTSIPACGGTLPDGGIDKGPDLGSAASTGSSCTKDTDCQGGKCLKEIVNEGSNLTMNGGYCSRDCTSAWCQAGEACFSSKTKTGKILGKWCMRTCLTPADCRSGEGYSCLPAHNICMPGSPALDGGP